MTVNNSARNALRVLLDDAERRDYDPPVPSIVLSELEWIIAHTTDHEKSPVPDNSDS